LLLEFFGIYGGDDSNFLKAQRVHRDLVDAMRMLQMSHDGSANETFQDSSDEAEEEEETSGTEGRMGLLEEKWDEFVKRETRKRYVTVLFSLGGT
jgi:hypothetical protein